MSDVIEGGCKCGAIRYRIDAEPAFAAHCCCTACQKLSGGGHTTFIIVPSAALTVTGEPATYHYTADSGTDVQTSFCGACGSPLFGNPSRMADLTGVRVGSLDDPSAVRPAAALFVAERHDWDTLDAGLRTFEGMMPSPDS